MSGVATNLWWAFFAELPFLLVLYRFWKTWQHYAGAIVVGSGLSRSSRAVSFDLGSMVLPMQIGFFSLVIVSAAVGTWLGIFVADRLEHAGVARMARRRPKPVTINADAPA